MSETKLTDMVTDMAIKLEGACSKEESSTVVDLLKALNKMEVDREIMQKSKIAFAVKKCRAAESMPAEAKELAKQLLDKWKKALKGDGNNAPPKKANGTGQAGEVKKPQVLPSAPTSSQSNDASKGSATTPAVKTEKGGVKKEEVKKEEKKVVSIETYGFPQNASLAPHRVKVQNLFLKTLLKYAGDNDKSAAWTAMSVEHGINEAFFFQEQPKLYAEKVRSLLSNLDVNSDLRDEVMNGNISAQVLVKMAPGEMQSEEMKRAAMATRKYAAEEANPDISEYRDKVRANLGLQSEGGSFQCRRCKGVKTSHYAKQTRSSDEPMTMFITCETCGFRWRE